MAFSSVQTCGLVNVNQPLPWFSLVGQERFQDKFLVSRTLGGKCRRLSGFCHILLQDVTPLHVKITSSTNLLSVCRRKLKFSIDLFKVARLDF